MNPYCMDIGTEDDDYKIVTAPDKVAEPVPTRLPEPQPIAPEPSKVPSAPGK